MRMSVKFYLNDAIMFIKSDSAFMQIAAKFTAREMMLETSVPDAADELSPVCEVVVWVEPVSTGDVTVAPDEESAKFG